MHLPRLFAPLLALFLTGCSGVSFLNALASPPATVRAGVVYDEASGQKADIYETENAADSAPVLLFIYGGSWQDGSRDIYEFLGSAFAESGIETVIADYRKYPDVIHPALTEDVAAAIAWTKSEIAKDRPLFVMGHSAGAHLSALALTHPKYLAKHGTSSCKAVTGYIGVSGPYDFLFKEEVYKKIFPEPVREDAKPVVHAADQPQPPWLLLHGTADTTVPPLRTEQMRDALKAAGNPVDAKFYDGVNHTMIIGAVAPLVRGRAPTFEDVLAFIEAATDMPSPCPSETAGQTR